MNSVFKEGKNTNNQNFYCSFKHEEFDIDDILKSLYQQSVKAKSKEDSSSVNSEDSLGSNSLYEFTKWVNTQEIESIDFAKQFEQIKEKQSSKMKSLYYKKEDVENNIGIESIELENDIEKKFKKFSKMKENLTDSYVDLQPNNEDKEKKRSRLSSLFENETNDYTVTVNDTERKQSDILKKKKKLNDKKIKLSVQSQNSTSTGNNSNRFQLKGSSDNDQMGVINEGGNSHNSNEFDLNINNSEKAIDKRKRSGNTKEGNKTNNSKDKDLISKDKKVKDKKITSKEISIVDILNNKDKRTTIMIRHIPNKYTLDDLSYEIDELFYGKYTYINLPLDYSVYFLYRIFIILDMDLLTLRILYILFYFMKHM